MCQWSTLGVACALGVLGACVVVGTKQLLGSRALRGALVSLRACVCACVRARVCRELVGWAVPREGVACGLGVDKVLPVGTMRL